MQKSIKYSKAINISGYNAHNNMAPLWSVQIWFDCCRFGANFCPKFKYYTTGGIHLTHWYSPDVKAKIVQISDRSTKFVV